MGTYYTAKAILGYKIKEKKLPAKKIIVHSCEHPERHNNVFCPVCGTRVSAKQKLEDRNEKFQEFLEWFYEECPSKYTTEIDMEYSQNLWIGHGISVEAFEFKKLETSNISLKSELLTLLIPWEDCIEFDTEADYGIWLTNIGH